MSTAKQTLSSVPKKRNKSCEHECSSNESDIEVSSPDNEIKRIQIRTDKLNRATEKLHGRQVPTTLEISAKVRPGSCKGRQKSSLRNIKAAMSTDDGMTTDLNSDDCCSEISTTSTKKSFRMLGLHPACQAPPPEYNFQPNLKRAREEIVQRRRSPSVDLSLETKLAAVNRRKEYAKALKDQRANSIGKHQKHPDRKISLERRPENPHLGKQFFSENESLDQSEGERQRIQKRKISGRQISDDAGRSFIPRLARTKKAVIGGEDATKGDETDSLLSTGASTPVIRRRDQCLTTAHLAGPTLLDEDTWTKIEELVKTENRSVHRNRRLSWLYGFLAGIVAATTVNLLALWWRYDSAEPQHKGTL